MSSLNPQKASIGSRLLDAGWLLILLCMAAGLWLVFSIPWITLPIPGATNLARYAPMADGDSWLTTQYTSGGEILSYISNNIREVAPNSMIILALEEDAHSILDAFIRGPDRAEADDKELIRELALAEAFMIDSREIRDGLPVFTSSRLVIRSSAGDFLFREVINGGADIHYYDPPIQLRPARLEPGTTWDGSGITTDNMSYRFQGKIVTKGSYTNLFGQEFPDCLKLDFSLALGGIGTPDKHTTQSQWMCDGVGVVAEEEMDENSIAPVYSQANIRSTYSLPGQSGDANLGMLPEPVPLEQTISPADMPEIEAVSRWKLTEISSPLTGEEEFLNESTIRPVWVPSGPPLLLTATLNDDLVARSAVSPGYEIRWKFHPGGTIFGQPGIDIASGNIFFGSSSGRLIALDANGMFLWSFNAGDNIASQPLVVGDIVIFGSEDRHVYALDKKSGILNWDFSTSGAVVSSPASVDEWAVIGSDDGNVYALDVKTGDQVWVFPTDDAVEAPIISNDGVIYIASRDATLYALDGSNGKLIWNAETSDALRSALAIGKDSLYLCDEYGALYAFGLESGKYLWSDDQLECYGPALVRDDTLIVASADGRIFLYSTDGNERYSPVTAFTKTGERSSAGFYMGIAEGGGAAWLADFHGQVWRFGP
jgi:outer membrane protein assembly factor BamB